MNYTYYSKIDTRDFESHLTQIKLTTIHVKWAQRISELIRHTDEVSQLHVIRLSLSISFKVYINKVVQGHFKSIQYALLRSKYHSSW
jgi:hypothetical protein